MRIWGRLFFYYGLLLKLANSSRGFPHELSSTVLQVKKKYIYETFYIRPIGASFCARKRRQTRAAKRFQWRGTFNFSGGERRQQEIRLWLHAFYIHTNNYFGQLFSMWGHNDSGKRKTENINQSGVKSVNWFCLRAIQFSYLWLLNSGAFQEYLFACDCR